MFVANPTWRGSISFGLVSVPVELYTAVRSHTIRFKQLHRETEAPVKQKRVDSQTGEEVPYRDIVKGYEVDDGQYVIVDPDELEQLAPEASRLICIHAYVEQGEIDPVYYDRAYYLAPDGEVARKPYRLLTEAMEQTDQVAIATFVMRNREYLAALRARHGTLVLSTMHYADEVADPGHLRVDVSSAPEPSDRERSMAEQLIGAMSAEFDPQDYRDHHRDRVLEFLEAKGEGRPFQVDGGGDGDTGNVVDLTAALERSLSRSNDRARSDTGGGASDGYDDLTRGELYELARDRELPGRSSMAKDELIAALRESDAEQGAA
jgi:DNA end-binding protein Ku